MQFVKERKTKKKRRGSKKEREETCYFSGCTKRFRSACALPLPKRAAHFLHFLLASSRRQRRRRPLPFFFLFRFAAAHCCRLPRHPMAPTGRLLAVAALSFLCLQGLWGDSGSAFAQSQPPLHRIVLAEANDGGGLMPELPPSGLMPMPDLSPSGSPRPFVPFLAPAPLAPFFNNSTPKLSGKCTLNFTAVDKLMTTTAVDCFTSFAPFLANVICCPQLQATLTILIGQSSKQTGSLALDPTVANYCLSDVQELLLSQGASDNLHSLCSVHLSNVTEGSCPVSTVDAFESVVDSSKLLEACRKIDSVNECCSQTCQNAINEAAQKISSKDGGLTSYTGGSKTDSCRNVVLRWLSSRLDPQSAKQMLRQISNCNVNGVCPLSFPDTSKVAKECGGTMKNSTACCKAMLTYVAHLQKQSFITNLQALNCASFLGAKLQKMNVSMNVYSSCQITLKDFSLQVGSQESGCLLPSMPSDASFDSTSGISFTCDLNDNIAAPWPSSMQAPSSSCNKSVNIPERPAATSAQNGVNHENLKLRLLASLVSLLLVLLVQV